MTDLVSQYIKKGLHSLYYAFYVIIEGIFKVSHSWNPIISIAGIISLLVALPLISIIRLLFLCWMDLDIPVHNYMEWFILVDISLLFSCIRKY